MGSTKVNKSITREFLYKFSFVRLNTFVKSVISLLLCPTSDYNATATESLPKWQKVIQYSSR